MSAEHTRLRILRAKTSAFCPEHKQLERVVDVFNLSDAVVLKLSCGCRRSEHA